MSRIGRLPVVVPAGVTVEVKENNYVVVKGSKGTLERNLPVEMDIKVEDGHVVVTRHIDRTNKEIEKRMKMPPKKASFFKKETSNPLTDYIDELNKSCFICDRINNTFERYLHTVVATWKSDAAFRELYAKGKGFCTDK